MIDGTRVPFFLFRLSLLWLMFGYVARPSMRRPTSVEVNSGTTSDLNTRAIVFPVNNNNTTTYAIDGFELVRRCCTSQYRRYHTIEGVSTTIAITIHKNPSTKLHHQVASCSTS